MYLILLAIPSLLSVWTIDGMERIWPRTGSTSYVKMMDSRDFDDLHEPRVDPL